MLYREAQFEAATIYCYFYFQILKCYFCSRGRLLPPDVVVVSPAGRRGRVSRRTSCLPLDVVSPAGRRGRRLPLDVLVVVSRWTSWSSSPAGRRVRRLQLDVVVVVSRWTSWSSTSVFVM